MCLDAERSFLPNLQSGLFCLILRLCSWALQLCSALLDHSLGGLSLHEVHPHSTASAHRSSEAHVCSPRIRHCQSGMCTPTPSTILVFPNLPSDSSPNFLQCFDAPPKERRKRGGTEERVQGGVRGCHRWGVCSSLGEAVRCGLTKDSTRLPTPIPLWGAQPRSWRLLRHKTTLSPRSPAPPCSYPPPHPPSPPVNLLCSLMPADAHRVLSPGSEKGAAETQSKESRSREGCWRRAAVTAQREGVAITVSSGARRTWHGGPGPTVHPGRVWRKWKLSCILKTEEKRTSRLWKGWSWCRKGGPKSLGTHGTHRAQGVRGSFQEDGGKVGSRESGNRIARGDACSLRSWGFILKGFSLLEAHDQTVL